ncbi:FecR family protein [Flavobacterium aquidurense]|uniref:Iron dicitrate transport regulator FecR n=1 Tax=Flavobacterium frigidimaris TaxID=262320 RepID=A0ABX4BR09_FLAFR|nr:FecR family protein [Flavobacterium frigidimaris]OXA79072.1 iron dicitrate transport regulator FecR [Flavobacterium frigidimaris]SDY80944.1 FecR family protein [Flavobacterium aquidurense]
MDEKKIEEELKKIWDETPISHSDNVKEASWEDFQSKAFSPKKQKFKIWRYTAAASVLLLMGIGVGIYFNRSPLQNNRQLSSNVIEIENSTLKVKTVFLPDSSKVELNPNSKISYVNNFETNRKIEVIGEAYFKVKKDKKHPFQVFCHETTTTVLGTSFTVKGNKQSEVRVSLYEGSVEMSIKNQSKKWILVPGETFTYGKDNETTVTEFNRFTDFDNAKLTEVCTYIKENYGYKTTLPQEFDNQRITIRINKKEDLKIIVQLISEMYNLNFEINEELKVIAFQ